MGFRSTQEVETGTTSYVKAPRAGGSTVQRGVCIQSGWPDPGPRRPEGTLAEKARAP